MVTQFIVLTLFLTFMYVNQFISVIVLFNIDVSNNINIHVFT